MKKLFNNKISIINHLLYLNFTKLYANFIKIIESGFSSVGRAFDCRGHMEIKGSLVQIREAGFFFSNKNNA